MSNPEQPWTPSNRPPAPPPPPGYDGYSPGPPAAQSGKAIAILVLGICGLVFLCGYGVGVVLAIVALALAPSARREIAASNGRLQGDGFIKAGVICSWIAVGIIVAVVVVAFIIALLSAAVSSGT